jgi:prenyltransferase beta subunit
MQFSRKTNDVHCPPNRFHVLVNSGIIIGLSLLIANIACPVASADEAAILPTSRMWDRIPESQWNQIDASIDRAIDFLASQQQPDGSFPTYVSAKPGVTSLCVMSMLSRGHLPGETRMGQVINRGIDFVLSTQRLDGLFTDVNVNDRVEPWQSGSHVSLYNHGICGTMLGEAYGCTDPTRSDLIAAAIRRALLFTQSRQVKPSQGYKHTDHGGWRYYGSHFDGGHADLSVTSWQLMFLRSAENAGFQVPSQYPEAAIEYVKRCYKPSTGAFLYKLDKPKENRAMTGAGVTCLFLAGQQDQELERRSARWLMNHPYHRVVNSRANEDRFFYGAYYCSLASLLIGDECWEKVYGPLSTTLVDYQQRDGSWPVEAYDAMFGDSYSTAMAVLALSPPYQLLPIYQR